MSKTKPQVAKKAAGQPVFSWLDRLFANAVLVEKGNNRMYHVTRSSTIVSGNTKVKVPAGADVVVFRYNDQKGKRRKYGTDTAAAIFRAGYGSPRVDQINVMESGELIHRTNSNRVRITTTGGRRSYGDTL